MVVGAVKKNKNVEADFNFKQSIQGDLSKYHLSKRKGETNAKQTSRGKSMSGVFEELQGSYKSSCGLSWERYDQQVMESQFVLCLVCSCKDFYIYSEIGSC